MALGHYQPDSKSWALMNVPLLTAMKNCQRMAYDGLFEGKWKFGI